MRTVLRLVAVAALAIAVSFSATANAQDVLSPYDIGTGELVPQPHQNGCGPYFVDGGSQVSVSIKARLVNGLMLISAVLAPKASIRVTHDEMKEVPYVQLVTDMETANLVLLVTASTFDIQRANCLGVITNK